MIGKRLEASFVASRVRTLSLSGPPPREHEPLRLPILQPAFPFPSPNPSMATSS
jgi:hypothetical protein